MIRRAFLNKTDHNSIAAIYARVDDESEQLVISDCNRTVDLDVGSWSSDDRENTLFKLNTMISVLSAFREAFKKKCSETDLR